MHYKELCGKSFLSSDDLEEGKVIAVVIEQALREDAFDPKTRKPKPVGILKFQNKSLRMIMNVVNSVAVMELYGKDTDQWIGQTIYLYRTTTRVAGKVVPCLRIKTREELQNSQ
jgi:hypothetical protein